MRDPQALTHHATREIEWYAIEDEQIGRVVWFTTEAPVRIVETVNGSITVETHEGDHWLPRTIARSMAHALDLSTRFMVL